jgi:hypothetical protein
MRQQSSMPEIPSTSYPIKINSKERPHFQLRITEPKFKSSSMWPCIHHLLKINKQEIAPRFDDYLTYMKIENSMNIEVIPEITRTDKNLQKIDPFVRGCFFENEKKLKYFKIYTTEYCGIECLRPLVDEVVECNEINMVYDKGPKKKPFCTTSGIESSYAKRHFESLGNFSFDTNCSCLPPCNSINYHIKYFPINDDGINGTTVINVRMNTDDMILYRRYQQFFFSDAVSYVGGLLGLFAGISVLSIVEIFYFFSLRLCSDLLRLLKRQ